MANKILSKIRIVIILNEFFGNKLYFIFLFSKIITQKLREKMAFSVESFFEKFESVEYDRKYLS